MFLVEKGKIIATILFRDTTERERERERESSKTCKVRINFHHLTEVVRTELHYEYTKKVTYSM